MVDKYLENIPTDIVTIINKYIWKGGINKKIVWDNMRKFKEAIEECSLEFWKINIDNWNYYYIVNAIYSICDNGSVSMMKKIIEICDFYNINWDDDIVYFANIIIMKNDHLELFKFLTKIKKINCISPIKMAIYYDSNKIFVYLLKKCDPSISKLTINTIHDNHHILICKTHSENNSTCSFNVIKNQYMTPPKLKRQLRCIIPRNI